MPASPSFRESIWSIAVPWLLDTVGGGLLYATGLVLDALHERTRQSVRARMPGYGTPTALAFLGSDRQIERGPTETEDHYVPRLQGALDSWRRAGNAFEFLIQVQAYFSPTLPEVRVVSDASVWHTIDTAGAIVREVASPANWTWDVYSRSHPSMGDPPTPRWWRAWLIVDSSSGPWSSWAVGSGVIIGDGSTIGSTATELEVEQLRRRANKWKPANVDLRAICVVFDASLFQAGNAPGGDMPDGDFDNPVNRYGLDAAFLELDYTTGERTYFYVPGEDMRVTEGGDQRITEGGDNRVTE